MWCRECGTLHKLIQEESAADKVVEITKPGEDVETLPISEVAQWE